MSASAQPPARPRSPWAYLRPYKGQVALGVIMLLATNALFLAEPVLVGMVIDAVSANDPDGRIPTLALLMIVFAVGTAITRIISRTALFNTARDAEYDLRGQIFGHLLRLEPAFYRQHSTGDVMSRLTNDVQTVRAMWGPGLLNIVNTAFAFITVLAMMIRIDPVLTLWAILPYPGMVIFGRLFGRRMYRFSRAVQEQLGALSSSIQEDLSGIGVIKSYNLEKERRRLFRGLSERLLRRNMELTNVRGQLMPVLTGLGSLGTIIVLWIGGQAVVRGDMSLGSMVEFSSYLARLVWPTLALGWMISLLQRGLASWQRLCELLDYQPKIVDGAAGETTDGAADGSGDGPRAAGPVLDPAEIRGDLELRGLTVAFDGQKVLDDVHLSLPAGTVTAIVGRTGSGKSTLVEALPRLIDVPRATIFLDGHDITTLPLRTLRNAIGYAPQEAFLFSTTIARNIAFGYERYQGGAPAYPVSEDSASRDRLAQAAAGAGLTRDLAALPDGYDTVVGERGITLSGGQRQRVALARALATAPRVLVLDDSLSSVDAETERDILTHLTELMRGRTAILISHRVAAVKRADRIVVLDEGKVVEAGTHDELLAAGGLYAEVYRTQLEPDDSTDEPDAEPGADAGAEPGAGPGDGPGPRPATGTDAGGTHS